MGVAGVPDWTGTFTHPCDTCGHTVRVIDTKARRHICRLRLIGRVRTKAANAAWLDGYRFALDNVSDPMVRADLVDFGSGWAGLLDAGAVTIDTREDGGQS